MGPPQLAQSPDLLLGVADLVGQETSLGLQLGNRKSGASFYSFGDGPSSGNCFQFFFFFLDNSVVLSSPS